MTSSSPYFQIKGLIASAGSHIFSIEFKKKDGSVKTMKVQNAVAKFHIKGDSLDNKNYEGVKRRAEMYPHILNLWSIEENGFRAVNIHNVISMKVNGNTWYLHREEEKVKMKNVEGQEYLGANHE